MIHIRYTLLWILEQSTPVQTVDYKQSCSTTLVISFLYCRCHRYRCFCRLHLSHQTIYSTNYEAFSNSSNSTNCCCYWYKTIWISEGLLCMGKTKYKMPLIG